MSSRCIFGWFCKRKDRMKIGDLAEAFHIPNISVKKNEELWKAVYKQARRSPFDKFRTGAIVFKNNGTIFGKGCSHNPINNPYNMNSIHAETEALNSLSFGQGIGCNVLILTLTKANKVARSSRPCYACVKDMAGAGIHQVYYPEMTNDGFWVLNKEWIDNLLERAEASGIVKDRYASRMKIK